MKVRITLLPSGKKSKVIDLPKGATAEEAICRLDLYPDAWIPVRDGTPVPLDSRLKEGDDLKLVAVVSGG